MLSQTIRNFTIAGFLIILISVPSFIIYRLKSKNKELILIKGQNEANEKIYQLMLTQKVDSDKARLEERNRIAMELHDGIVNKVFTTRYNLMQLQTEQSAQKEALVQELIAAESEIRKVSHELQQNLFFEDKSFQDALQKLIDSQKNEFNTKFDLYIDKFIEWSNITSENKVHIYRIIQEAVQNINKYAQAKNADIMVMKTNEKITIQIEDNGCGFHIEKKSKGLGLQNIKYRASALNGKLTIISNSEGTILKISFIMDQLNL